MGAPVYLSDEARFRLLGDESRLELPNEDLDKKNLSIDGRLIVICVVMETTKTNQSVVCQEEIHAR